MKNIKISPLVILLFWPLDVFAYLDPGTGSVIIQSLIAAVAAVGYAIKIYWYKISSLFSRNKKKNIEKDVVANED